MAWGVRNLISTQVVAHALRAQRFEVRAVGLRAPAVFPLLREAAARGARGRPEARRGVEVGGRVLGPRGRRGYDGEEAAHAWLLIN